MTRRFVAVPVPDPPRRRLASLLEPIRGSRGLRFARPEGWHVTLAFIGELADERVPGAIEAVRGAVAGLGPPRLRIGGAGRFGGSVLWCAVADRPEGLLETLGGRVQEALADAGLQVQRRAVRPHVTVARARPRHRVTLAHVARLDDALRGLAEDQRTWRADAVELWSSVLGSGPARYEVDASVSLGAD